MSALMRLRTMGLLFFMLTALLVHLVYERECAFLDKVGYPILLFDDVLLAVAVGKHSQVKTHFTAQLMDLLFEFVYSRLVLVYHTMVFIGLDCFRMKFGYEFVDFAFLYFVLGYGLLAYSH